MLRVSQAQLSLLERNLRSGGQAPARPQRGPLRQAPQRGPRRKEDLPENQLERQITDFLAWRGFISTRQHVGTFVPYRVLKQLQCGRLRTDQVSRNIVRVGEAGAADWLSLRPVIDPGRRPLDAPWLWQGFFWEAKASGKRPSPAQLEWMNKRRQCGIEAWWFNEFQTRDRLSPAVEPRDSHVFETWFSGYFDDGGSTRYEL